MTLIVNRSNEWLQVFSAVDFDGILGEDRNDAADDFTENLMNGLKEAGFETEIATGQKATCHGWNGANTFATTLGPVASYKELSEDARCQICEITNRAEVAMRCDWIEAVEEEDDN